MKSLRYSIDRNNDGLITFECLNGGIGSKKPRVVRGSKNVSVMDLLNRMDARGYIEYEIRSMGQSLSPKEWDALWKTDEYENLEIRIKSDLDVLTLCGNAWLCCIGRSGRGHHKEAPKYTRPASKKAVQSSWLYQCGTDLIEA